MTGLLRSLVFLLVIRPLALLVLGFNVRHRERLPGAGPAIVVANHNSHLDTVALMTLFPHRLLARLRPVAAADYFLGGGLLTWFAREIIGILPMARTPTREVPDPLAPCAAALDRGEILIFFPEGSRGEPERLSAFKGGVARLAERHPEATVVPVFLHGLGKALPKGSWLLVPFFCDVFVGRPVAWTGERRTFMAAVDGAIHALAAEDSLPAWE